MGEQRDTCCGHQSQYKSVQQSLGEMDFERGVWSAALDGELQRVRDYLQRQGGHADATDSSGYTALHYAARNGHRDICQLLLDNRATVDAATRSGKVTPLHRAAYTGQEAVVALLLQRGADPTLQDADGKTALHKACERQHAHIARRLLERDRAVAGIKDIRDKQPLDYVQEDTPLRQTLLQFMS